ncbi:MAG: hypothetical protein QG656_1442 [Candidatus Hydrogenedentes bacterium]|nr:hypothetical protein [Candidatus Hydrogenedentota bacterium]
MRTLVRLSIAFAALSFICGVAACNSAFAAVVTMKTDKPVADEGWPSGVLEFVNLGSRFAWYCGEADGTTYCFRGGMGALRRDLETFAAIRAPELNVIVKDDSLSYGPIEHVDWEFTAVSPRAFYREYHNLVKSPFFIWNESNLWQPLPPQTLIVYAGKRIRWDSIDVPKNLHVIDKRDCASPYPVEDGVVLEGIVYDMGTGKTLAGATVELRTSEDQDALSPGLSTTTEADGRFHIVRIPPNSYFVDFKVEGYAVRREFVPLMTPRAHDNITVYLAKAVSVRGKVLDSEGKPATGAQVAASAAHALDGQAYDDYMYARPWVDVDAEGAFELTGLPEGYATLMCGHGWTCDWKAYSFETPAEDVVIRAERTGALTGTVSVGAEDKPMEDLLHVKIESEPAGRIGSYGGSMEVKDGKFDIKEIPPGPYKLTLQAQGYSTVPEPQQIEVKPGETLELRLRIER